MLASVAFVVTALAFAVVPVLEEKAKAMGETPPPSPFRDSLREHGGTLELLAGTSHLPLRELLKALEQLITLNLVDRRGTLHEYRYSIHNLTRSYLHKQVVLWQ